MSDRRLVEKYYGRVDIGQESKNARLRTTHSELYSLVTSPTSKFIDNLLGEEEFFERVYESDILRASATTEKFGGEVKRDATFVIVRKSKIKVVILYPAEKSPVEINSESLQQINPIFPNKPYIPTNPDLIRQIVDQNSIQVNLLSDQRITELLQDVTRITRPSGSKPANGRTNSH